MSEPKKRGEVKMSFTFSGMGAADKFRDELKRLDLPAEMDYRAGRWIVSTNTKALAHADTLAKLIGGSR